MLREAAPVSAWGRAVPVPCTRTPREGVVVPVASLAGIPPPDDGGWLLVTRCEAPGGEFTARVLASPLPHAHGGDVLIVVSVHERQSGPRLVHAQVLTVARADLVRVAMWETPELASWPSRVHPAALFAVTAMEWLEARGADIGADCATCLDAGQVSGAGLPLPAECRTAGTGF
jgi:hypothetical protein